MGDWPVREFRSVRELRDGVDRALGAGSRAQVPALWSLLSARIQEPADGSSADARELDQLRRRLREAILSALDDVPAEQARAHIDGIVAAARERYDEVLRHHDLDAHARAERLHELSADLLWTRARLDHVSDDTDHDPLSDLVGEVDQCRGEVALLAGAVPEDQPGGDTIASLRTEASELSLLALGRRVDQLESVMQQGRSAPSDAERFEASWRAFVVAGELEIEARGLSAELGDGMAAEVEDIARRRNRIRSSIESSLEGMESEVRRRAMERVVLDLVDHSEEILIGVEEEEPARALADLAEAGRELEWARQQLVSHEPALQGRRTGWLPGRRRHRDPLVQAHASLERAQRRVVAEHVEKTVNVRMEALLGRRFTAFLENLVFILILLFLVLMYAEARVKPRPGPTLLVEEEAMSASARQITALATGIDGGVAGEAVDLERLEIETLLGYSRLASIAADSTPVAGGPGEALAGAALEMSQVARAAQRAREDELREEERVGWWHRFFAYADLGICVVFLFEFFLKLTLAPRRLNYARRHFFIDFLPSIPFGYISWAITQTMMPGGAEAMRSVRALRLMRVPRVIRYVRLARPVVRMFRVFTFAMRGLDRLVRRHAGLLNRQVIFFEPLPPQQPAAQLRDSFIGLQGRVQRRYRATMDELSGAQRAGFVQRRMEELREHLPWRRPADRVGAGTTRVVAATREIAAEDLLRSMVAMDAITVEDLLGRDLVLRLRRALGILSAPGLRRLPVLRDMTSGLDRLDPYEIVAQAIRVLGRVSQHLLGRVHAIADLYGIVTAPQLLDRVGGALVKALGRPAKRLIIFGVVFLIIKMILGVFEIGFLQAASAFFGKILSTAFLLLGGLCLAPLLLGIWLRRIAGEASDFYERAVEAQFLPLLRGVKQETLGEDLQTIFRRVLEPEVRASSATASPVDEVTAVARLETAFLRARPHELPAVATTELDGRNPTLPLAALAHHWEERQRVLELYRDYLEGAPLHRGDVKVANLFLGNLDMENVHRERLGLSRRELKKLERLDLARERSILGGPHMWFNFITDGVAQRVAKLMIDYNRHCLPIDEVASASPEERALHAEWMVARRLKRVIPDLEEPEEPDAGESGGKPRRGRSAYVTTAFTALHFVTRDPERDRLVELVFGREVLEQLERDRVHVIRSVFGSYPLPSLPRAQRTLNPYRFYLERMSGGTIFLLPFLGLWLWMRSMIWCARVLLRNIREILQPSFASSDPVSSYASYEIAERKICRMRKPISMAAMLTRARFDPEYLGLTIPGGTAPPEDCTFRADLDRIGAPEEERVPFEELARERHARHRRLLDLLAMRGLLGRDALVERLRQLGGAELAARPDAALRAMTIAYLIDYRDAASLIEADGEVMRIFRSAMRVRRGRPRRLARLRRWMRGGDGAFDAWWQGSPLAGASAEARERCLAAVADDEDGVRRKLELLAAAGGAAAARERGVEVLLEAARRPGAWSEQIVTVRTVQTLAMLDIECYRRLVRQLGGYGRSEP